MLINGILQYPQNLQEMPIDKYGPKMCQTPASFSSVAMVFTPILGIHTFFGVQWSKFLGQI